MPLPILTYRGIAWREQGDLDLALADLTEALRINPKSAVAYRWRGEIWRDKYISASAAGDFFHEAQDYSARADADLREAKRLNPRDPKMMPSFRSYRFTNSRLAMRI